MDCISKYLGNTQHFASEPKIILHIDIEDYDKIKGFSPNFQFHKMQCSFSINQDNKVLKKTYQELFNDRSQQSIKPK